MSHGLAHLGDTHNFGRHVRREGDWVIKPRPLFWEWLFLSSSSPLRQIFSADRLDLNPFKHFPSLEVQDFNLSRSFSDQAIEFYEKGDDEGAVSISQLPEALGNILAITYVFGLSDLHFENLVLARDRELNTLHFFPLDIETALDPLQILSQSYLLKSSGNDSKIAGLRLVDGFTVDPTKVIKAFLESVEVLEDHKPSVEKLFGELDLSTVPNRRILKSTSVYADFLRGKTEANNLTLEELVQLKRGDVPYFFSFGTDDRLFVIGVSGIEATELVWNDHYPIHRSRFEERDGHLNSLSKQQIKESLLQIARNFQPIQDQTFISDQIMIRYQNNDIFLQGPGMKLRCRKL